MPGWVPLEVRNRRFDLGAHVPRNWHGCSQSVTSFLNSLSITFPVGERFFIQSVRAFRDAVTDPVLREEVKLFCAQEGMHGREHTRYNEMVAAQGYPVEKLEREVKALLDLGERVLPPRLQLGATCALEHFTALLAEVFLTDPRMVEKAHPEMARLWLWHSVEENEHKAVAFDVFRAAGGTEAERIGMMVVASLLFWAYVLKQQVQLMRADGIATSPREWAALLDFCLGNPGCIRVLVKPYLAYYRRGFHPCDHDTRHLNARWEHMENAYTAAAAS